MKHDSHDDRVVILFVKGYFGFTKPQLEAMIRMKKWQMACYFFHSTVWQFDRFTITIRNQEIYNLCINILMRWILLQKRLMGTEYLRNPYTTIMKNAIAAHAN